jgi:MoaA/NifB/PqqE/SkfB family radical SAM enzyme
METHRRRPSEQARASGARAGAALVPERFSRIHRVRRKLRRLANEVRAQSAERSKRPDLASVPVHVNLNHTMICNLRCVMCEQGLTHVPQRVMELDVYRRVRDELFDRISELSLTVMGDPFCVPKPFLREILDDVERFDLRLEITTNGLLFGDEEELERLARLVNRMVLSIDGATPATYERIRKPGKWDRLVDNVERFQRARRRLPPWRRPLIYFNYVVMKSNLEELPDFVDLAAGWDGHEVSAAMLITVDPAIAHEACEERDPRVLEVLSEARRRALEHGLRFRVGGAHPELMKSLQRNSVGLRVAALQAWAGVRPVFALGLNNLVERVGRRLRVAPRECPFLWAKTHVQIDGTIGTCCHPQYYVTGDLMQQPFDAIWNNRRYRGLRSSLNSEYPAGACKDCHLLR